MAYSMKKNLLCKVGESFITLTESPEIYLEVQQEKSEKFKIITKQLYDCVFSINGLTELKTQALQKLLIDGFDEEQIWQQLELQNRSALSHFSKCIPKLDPDNISLGFKIKNEDHSNNSVPLDAFSDEHSSCADEKYAFDDDSDSSIELQQHPPLPAPKKKINFASEVDDQFFKLSELEEYLKLEDLKEERGDLNTSEDENEIHFYQDIPSDSVNDDDIKMPKKSTRDLMYEDFFDAPEFGDESALENENEKLEEENNHIVEGADLCEYSDDFDDRGTYIEEIHDEEEENISNSIVVQENQKTAFELEQENIRKRIQEYEKDMLEPLPWHLTGEVAASNRPIDSLVDKETEFDCNAKQDLIVDNVLNEKIEDIIKRTIINKAFADVERKVKPNEELIAYKKEMVLDQAKSKKSLAEVYEEDYLKKKTKQEEEEEPKHKEIKKLMDELFPELHALFCHIPKPAVPDIKIVSNLPAITVEEVAPTSISDVALLAPEEVKKKSGHIKGQSERTDTDRKRERRKKKMLQKLKEKKRKEKLDKLSGNPMSARAKKVLKSEMLQKLKQHRNIKIVNMDEG